MVTYRLDYGNGLLCGGSEKPLMPSQRFDVLAPTETWLGIGTSQFVISDLVSSGYEFKHLPEANRKYAGGIGILYKSGLSVKVIERETSGIYTHFEHTGCAIPVGNTSAMFSIM